MTAAQAHIHSIGHFVDGQSLAGETGTRRAPVFNPSTGEVSGEVSLGDARVVDRAVAAAKAAFPKWSESSSLNRARVMFRFKELLNQHHDELAAIITREHGKVFSDAKGEVMRGIEVVEFACGAPQLLKTQFSDNIGGGIDNFSLRQPLGVCA